MIKKLRFMFASISNKRMLSGRLFERTREPDIEPGSRIHFSRLVCIGTNAPNKIEKENPPSSAGFE